jgi:hypothetical protein
VPVWRALSTLWLDTELDDRDLAAIVAVLRDSGLDRATLQHVYAVELAPVLGPNLLSVAGAWSGFDQDWLRARILEDLRRRPRLTRFWAWFAPTRRAVTYASDEPWRRILAMLDEAPRAGETARGSRK